MGCARRGAGPLSAGLNPVTAGAGTRRPNRHHAVVEMVGHHPPVHRIGAINPTRSPIDITNQKLGVVASAADAICVLRIIIVGIIPAIRRFIDQQFRHECAGQRAAVRASRVAHQQRLDGSITPSSIETLSRIRLSFL